MPQFLDTRGVPEPDRQEFWQETVCRNILLVEFDPRHDSRPQAAMSCTEVGSLGIREVVGGEHLYVRDERHVRANDPDSFQIGIPTRGTSLLIQDGREAQLSPGDAVMWDSASPYTLVMNDRFHWYVFLFPKHILRRADSELRLLTAMPIRQGEPGVGSVVSRFLLDLARSGPQLEDDPAAAMLGESAADLLAATARSQFGLPWAVRRPEAVLRERVLAFIETHHADPTLDPTSIAVAHNVSLRSLHHLFEDVGSTVMDTLRRTRLEAIRRDLTDQRLAHLSIARVAATHGYRNPTVFSRAFKAEFGVTPGEFRSGARAS